LTKNQKKLGRKGFRFYFGLSVGVFVIVGVSQLMEMQLDQYFKDSDLASKLASIFLILFFIVVGAFAFFVIDTAYDGVISRMLGSEREK